MPAIFFFVSCVSINTIGDISYNMCVDVNQNKALIIHEIEKNLTRGQLAMRDWPRLSEYALFKLLYFRKFLPVPEAACFLSGGRMKFRE